MKIDRGFVNMGVRVSGFAAEVDKHDFFYKQYIAEVVAICVVIDLGVEMRYNRFGCVVLHNYSYDSDLSNLIS